jgi:tRNA dimethylallyltransferase
MRKKPKVLVIVGPTASGKSALAVTLARRFRGEIISADSRQVYRELDIGTGKITKGEQRGVQHHLLDVASPRRTFTAQDFIHLGRKKIETIIYDSALPIVVGGTGFYIDALLGRVTLPDVPPNQKLRQRLKKKSVSALYALLKKKDPRRARSIDPHNARRLIRALEIADALDANPPPKRQEYFDVLWVGIKPDEATLRKNIGARLKARMRAGMVAEARTLHARGLSYARMRALGLEYGALAHLLEGRTRKEEMLRTLERDIWRYAKRQMTYWKHNHDIQWFPSPRSPGIGLAIERWLKQ